MTNVSILQTIGSGERTSACSNIAPLKEGDSNRTAFSANTMNELIGAINLLLNMEGRNGIIITKSDSRIVISIDPDAIPTPTTTVTTTTPPPDTTFGIQWKGQWDTDTNYYPGDIVRRNLPEEYANGFVVGTYICVKEALAGTGVPEPTMTDNAYWQVFAPFACQRFVLRNEGEYIDINASLDDSDAMEILIGGTGSPLGRIQLNQSDCSGQLVSLNPEVVCDANESKTKIFLDSANFI